MKQYKVLFLILLICLTACQPNNTDKKNGNKIQLYTSIYPLQYAAEQIAGDKAIVESIYPAGVDAHTYEPSSRDITKLANGDALLFLGAGMEGFAETIANALESQEIDLIELGEDKSIFNASHDEKEDDHSHSDLDPHIWLDPLRMIEIGAKIKEELIRISPENESLFTDNFTDFKQKMLELDESFTETLHDKPNKKILVTHAAYGYWEERYGIEQIAISGISSSDEPSQKELANIANTAKENDLHYIIFETSTSNKVASIIQDYIGAEKLYIHNLEVRTETEIEQNEDYVTLMKKNLHVLNKAIGDGGN